MIDEKEASIVVAARALVANAPRIVSRQDGEFGAAWDVMLEALEESAHDDIEIPERAHEPAGEGDSFGGLGFVIAASSEMQASVDAIGDDRLSRAWHALKLVLVGGGDV